LSAPRLERWEVDAQAAREAFAALFRRLGADAVTPTALSREYHQRLQRNTPRASVDLSEGVAAPAFEPVLALLVMLDRALPALNQGYTAEGELLRGVIDYTAREIAGTWRGYASEIIRFAQGRSSTLAGFIHVGEVLVGQGKQGRERLDAACPGWRDGQGELLASRHYPPYWLTSDVVRARFRQWTELAEAELGNNPGLSPAAAIRLMCATLNADLSEGVPLEVMKAVVGAGVRLDSPLEGTAVADRGETVQALFERAEPGTMRALWCDLLLRARLQCTHRIEQAMPTL